MQLTGDRFHVTEMSGDLNMQQLAWVANVTSDCVFGYETMKNIDIK